MHSVLVASLAGLSCLSSVVSAAPFKFPLPNGFPNISIPSSQLTDIEKAAHGSLPVAAAAAPGAAPAQIPTEDTFVSLRFIAFNELAEVAFFTELINNVTHKVDGFNNLGNEQDVNFLLEALNAVQAQEELHALNANAALKKFGKDPIQPCQYNFDVTNFEEAINLAATFTDVTLGTLQDVEGLLGKDGDIGLIRGVASVIGQEGEQNGYYRTILGKIPSALPFLTASTRQFAFNALNQNFVVAGTCPNIGEIALPTFGTLKVETQNIAAKEQVLEFSIPLGTAAKGYDYSTLSMVYINQQNAPVPEQITDIQLTSSKVTFKANFPFNGTTFGNGLTLAALTTSTSLADLQNADTVAQVTFAGPGLIEIN